MIKSEIDSVQFVKDEIDDIRDSLDRLEAEGERRKAKLLEQVEFACKIPSKTKFFLTLKHNIFKSKTCYKTICTETIHSTNDQLLILDKSFPPSENFA